MDGANSLVGRLSPFYPTLIFNFFPLGGQPRCSRFFMVWTMNPTKGWPSVDGVQSCSILALITSTQDYCLASKSQRSCSLAGFYSGNNFRMSKGFRKGKSERTIIDVFRIARPMINWWNHWLCTVWMLHLAPQRFSVYVRFNCCVSIRTVLFDVSSATKQTLYFLLSWILDRFLRTMQLPARSLLEYRNRLKTPATSSLRLSLHRYWVR